MSLEAKLYKIGNIDGIDVYYDFYMEPEKTIWCRKGPEIFEKDSLEGYIISPLHKSNITKTVAIIGGSNDLNYYKSIIAIKKFKL